MSTKLSWVNPSRIKDAMALWSSGSGRLPVLFFSSDEPELLRDRISARAYSYSDVNQILDTTANRAPAGMTLAESLISNDEGFLRLVFPDSHNESYYPAMDNKRVATDGKLRSFAILVSDGSQYHSDAYHGRLEKYPFAVVPHIYLVGSVGAYQSGSDLEFEELDKWLLGRPLYIENNVLDTPFKILR